MSNDISQRARVAVYNRDKSKVIIESIEYDGEVMGEGLVRLSLTPGSTAEQISLHIQRELSLTSAPSIDIIEPLSTSGTTLASCVVDDSELRSHYEREEGSYDLVDIRQAELSILADDDIEDLLLLSVSNLSYHLGREGGYRLTSRVNPLEIINGASIILPLRIGAYYAMATGSDYIYLRLLEIDSLSVHVQLIGAGFPSALSYEELTKIRPSTWHLPIPIETLFTFDHFVGAAELDSASLVGMELYLSMMDEYDDEECAAIVRLLIWMSKQPPVDVKFTNQDGVIIHELVN